ncbi:type IIA DNA topoisomerase subunit B [Sutterella massiliensis]|uniref:DNA topoisomerase 4 subunit B n=1 Tax=Sutterella massiliensis TaxID=1816689 RepID=A0ABS2DR46_9BURK|nr:DNA topoisomerase IV subunit B [Sutterella massiliensis]MBM6703821.1 type IIA DNA topoisomerase subunit B [Sutterella massiliensis]
MAVKSNKADSYGVNSIRVLKGLEPVKQRPGMYTLTDNPLHIIQEVIDNASDEVLAGFGTRISVTVEEDGAITVEDNGRGIPTGLHPEEQVPVVELVFTRLHAGGKFAKSDGSGPYSFAGGLHGVGVSVTNALSTHLVVTVWRDGEESTIGFRDGFVAEPLSVRKSPRPKSQTGTRVRVYPDPKYFDSAEIPEASLVRLLRSKAVLLPGCEVDYRNVKRGVEEHWKYEGGLKEYLMTELKADPLIEPFEASGYADDDFEGYAKGEGASWVVAWTTEGPLTRESYVNLIPTPQGGTHESGLKDGLFQAMRAFMDAHGLQTKGVKVLAEDVFGRANFILSTKALDPQFQGQTKEKLTSRDTLKLVSSFVRAQFEFWLNDHLEEGKKLAEHIISVAQSRQRQAAKYEKKKTSSVAVLPGKLTDCETDDISRNELFIVEGDSAGGSAKMGRDKEFQAVLPLRGKILNTWEVGADELFRSDTIHDIALAIGVDPHHKEGDPDLKGLRYGKICILSDADVDGSHIQVLLLTLFFKHFPKLIELGHVYVAMPPLFRVDVPKKGRKAERKLYCLDDRELQRTLDSLRKEGFEDQQLKISRFKGLGEMKAEQLAETTLNPDTRRLLPVTFGSVAEAATQSIMNLLMAANESNGRRLWMEAYGNRVEADV